MTGFMTRALLQLFDRALADHLRNVEAGELKVITLVAPDVTRDPHLRLIEAVTAHAGGIFLNATGLWEGVTDRGDAELERVLESLGGAAPMIELIKDGDIVVARHPDGPDPETNEAARTFLGLVNALLDRRLVEETSELAVVVYDEAEFDADRLQASWELVTAQLRGMQLGKVRTLIVLVGAAQIDYRRHCARDRGVRFAIKSTDLVERRPWRDNLADIGRLADTTEPIVLFLAAGCSASSGMPVGDSMRDSAIRTMLNLDPSAEDLAERFYDYSRGIDGLLPGEAEMSMAEFRRGLTLERVLYLEQQGVPGNNYGPTMQDFARRHERALERRGSSIRAVQAMVALQKRLVLVTVNVDELVEDGHEDRLELFVTDEDFKNCAAYLTDYLRGGGPVPLLKFHGTVSSAETVVVSVDRVARGLTEAQVAALDALCGPADTPRTWFYVGASMRDRDLNQLLGLARYANGLDEWWVTPFRIPTIDQFIAEHRAQPWKEARRRSSPIERTITETADVFLGEFAELWTAKND
jgi:hypothetical protein